MRTRNRGSMTKKITTSARETTTASTRKGKSVRGARRGRSSTRVGNYIVETTADINSERNMSSFTAGPGPSRQTANIFDTRNVEDLRENSNLEIECALSRSALPYETPIERISAHASNSADGGSVGATSSGMFSPPDEEPENPIPFRAALEFIPKSFDGENMPVGRFINDCLFARDSIASKDRRYLFLMIRSRVVGNAFNSLQDRDLNSLEDLLRHLKETFTEHRSLSQLNSALATVAQRVDETVQQYGSRVSQILANLIELIEDKNPKGAAQYLIKSARDTANDNFIIGLKRDLIWRVRVDRPKSLQDSISLAKAAEWEVGFESGLNRKEIPSESEAKGCTEKSFQNKIFGNVSNRFRPYNANARIRKFEAGAGRASNVRGRGIGSGSDRYSERTNLNAQCEVTCHKCGETGHFALGCARILNSTGKSCHICKQSGHFARDCNKSRSRSGECFNCKKPGHYARDCTEGSNEKEKSRVTCGYCKIPGHSYDECFKRLSKVTHGRQDKQKNLNEK